MKERLVLPSGPYYLGLRIIFRDYIGLGAYHTCGLRSGTQEPRMDAAGIGERSRQPPVFKRFDAPEVNPQMYESFTAPF